MRLHTYVPIEHVKSVFHKWLALAATAYPDCSRQITEVLRNALEEAAGLTSPFRMLDIDKYTKWEMSGCPMVKGGAE